MRKRLKKKLYRNQLGQIREWMRINVDVHRVNKDRSQTHVMRYISQPFKIKFDVNER